MRRCLLKYLSQCFSRKNVQLRVRSSSLCFCPSTLLSRKRNLCSPRCASRGSNLTPVSGSGLTSTPPGEWAVSLGLYTVSSPCEYQFTQQLPSNCAMCRIRVGDVEHIALRLSYPGGNGHTYWIERKKQCCDAMSAAKHPLLVISGSLKVTE